MKKYVGGSNPFVNIGNMLRRSGPVMKSGGEQIGHDLKKAFSGGKSMTFRRYGRRTTNRKKNGGHLSRKRRQSVGNIHTIRKRYKR